MPLGLVFLCRCGLCQNACIADGHAICGIPHSMQCWIFRCSRPCRAASASPENRCACSCRLPTHLLNTPALAPLMPLLSAEPFVGTLFCIHTPLLHVCSQRTHAPHTTTFCFVSLDLQHCTLSCQTNNRPHIWLPPFCGHVLGVFCCTVGAHFG